MSSRPSSRGRSSKVLPEVEGLRKRASAISSPNGEYVPAFCEEERAALDHRVKNEAWDSLHGLLRFYAKYMLPVGVLTLIVCAIFAFMAYAIPNWLCHNASVDSSGANFGLNECIMNSNGDYSHLWGAKLFWLLFFAVMHPWSTAYPGYVAVVAMMNYCVSWRMHASMSFFTLGTAIMVLVGGARYQLAMDSMYFVAVYSVLALLVCLVSGVAVRRHTNNPVTYWRWVVCLLAMGPVGMIYKMGLTKIITARSTLSLNGLGLAIFRYLVHPTIWGLVNIMFRNVMRHIGTVPDMMQVIFLLYPMLYSAVYARFLLIQLNTVGSIVIQNVMQAAFQLANVPGDRGVDGLLMNQLYGKRAADALTASPTLDNQHLAEMITNSITQYIGVLGSAAVFSLGGVSGTPGVGPNHPQIWVDAALQCAIQLVQDFMQLAIEGKYHAFDWNAAFAKKLKRFFLIIGISCVIGGAHLAVELMLLFCPRYYEGIGILMEQCDKPSIFQAFNFAFALRNTNTFVGRKLGISLNNTAGINSA